MKTRNYPTHFASRRWEYLEELRKVIVACIEPSIIYCFYSCINNSSIKNCFSYSGKSEESHFYCGLLVVLGKNSELTEEEAKAKLQDISEKYCDMAAIVHTFDDFLELLEKKTFFYLWVHSYGTVLYETKLITKKIPRAIKEDVDSYRDQFPNFDLHNYLQTLHHPFRSCVQADTEISFQERAPIFPFLAALSWGMKNDCDTAVDTIDSIPESGNIDPSANFQLAKVRCELLELRNTVKNLYSIANDAISEYRPELSTISVDTFLHDTINLFSDYEKTSNKRIQLIITKEVSGRTINTDVFILRSAIQNILNIGLSESEKGTRLTLLCTENDGCTMFALGVHQIPLPQQWIEQSFIPFSLPGKNVQLGLSVCVTKMLIQKLGGTFRIQNENEFVKYVIGIPAMAA